MKKLIAKVLDKVIDDPELAAKVIVYGAIALLVAIGVASIAVRVAQ